EGEVVTLIGSNGAGKSTTLRSVCGLTPASAGAVTFAGENITRVAGHEIVTRGIAPSPEGRRCFARMTVAGTLDPGRSRRRGAAARGDVLEPGKIALTGDSDSLQRDPEVQKAYLGT